MVRLLIGILNRVYAVESGSNLKNAEIMSAMGSETHTLASFNALLGERMSPTAKANFLKGLSLAGLVTVNLSVDRETKEFNSEITRTPDGASVASESA